MADAALKRNECLYHIIIVHMLNMILKRAKESSRDVIMKKTYMKEKHETKNDELLFKAENIIGSFTRVKTA